MDSPLLAVNHLSVRFERDVLKDVSFRVNRGDVLAIVGPNGSGKSVLLRALLGLVPHEGDVEWSGNPKIGYVPQKLAIEHTFPLSVREFMQLKEPSHEKIIELLRSVGLGDHDSYHLHHHILNQRLGLLSGGQFQRVMVAWSLADHPDILLYDEPTSGVDVGGEETIYTLLDKMRRQHNLTLILVSHDLNIVYKYANTVMCLNQSMICYGVPQEVLDPAALTKLYGGQTSFYQHHHE